MVGRCGGLLEKEEIKELRGRESCDGGFVASRLCQIQTPEAILQYKRHDASSAGNGYFAARCDVAEWRNVQRRTSDETSEKNLSLIQW